MPTSPYKALADQYYNGRLDAYIAGQRADGVSWRKIATAIRDHTGGVIDPTPQTVRNWTV